MRISDWSSDVCSSDRLRAAADELEPPVSGMIARGLEVLRTQLKTMPNSPGVYRMLNNRGDALYVGKARNLKKRVSSYTRIPQLPHRLRPMGAETVTPGVMTTHNEGEALKIRRA